MTKQYSTPHKNDRQNNKTAIDQERKYASTNQEHTMTQQIQHAKQKWHAQ
jgi:hypothetical protein